MDVPNRALSGFGLFIINSDFSCLGIVLGLSNTLIRNYRAADEVEIVIKESHHSLTETFLSNFYMSNIVLGVGVVEVKRT